MYDTILVPTDGSPGAAGALVRAFDLALTFGGTVHALSVVDTRAEPAGVGEDDRAELRDRTEDAAARATEEVTDRAADHEVPTTAAVRTGVPHRAILEYAAEAGVDLVAMGTHGRTGPERTRLGSTTERVVTLADVPVLAVRLGETAVPEPGVGMYDHVVVPTDGSDDAERAAEHALGIAERYGADVHVIYVVDATTYDLGDAPRSIVGLLEEGGRNAVDAIAAAAGERNVPATTSVQRGNVEAELLDYATDVDADLIAMGTRGRTAGTDRLLGSTTARIVRRSEIPVLTVG